MRRTLLLVTCMLTTCAPAWAQAPLSASDQSETSAGVAARITGAASSSVTQVAPVFSLQGSTADKTASGQFGLQLRLVTLTIGAQVPLGGDAQRADLADLDGLKSKATGKVGVMWQHWRADLASYRTQLLKACGTITQRAPESQSDASCTYLGLKNDATEEGRRRFRALRRSISPGMVYFGGAQAAISPEEFTYIKSDDLSEGSIRHTSWSSGVFGGVLLPNATMLALSYRRQVAYLAKDEVQLCTPIGALAATQCSSQVLGAPGDPRKSHQAGIEVRRIFNQHFALSPKVTRDWTHHTTGAELPIYFFNDSGGGLNGGISLGYIFERKSVTATAFIGQVLGLITR